MKTLKLDLVDLDDLDTMQVLLRAFLSRYYGQKQGRKGVVYQTAKRSWTFRETDKSILVSNQESDHIQHVQTKMPVCPHCGARATSRKNRCYAGWLKRIDCPKCSLRFAMVGVYQSQSTVYSTWKDYENFPPDDPLFPKL